jgi:hypothetical protein
VLPAIVLGLVLAATGSILRFANATPAERHAEWFGDLAFGAVLAVPALLALVGLRGRQAMLLPAGVLGMAVGVMEPPISLPFAVPAVLYLVADRRAASDRPRAGRLVAASLLALVLGWAAFFSLFLRDDPVCWAVVPRADGRAYVTLPADRFVSGSGISMSSTDLPAGATESGCTSDTISPFEGLVAVALVLATLVIVRTTIGPPVRQTAVAPSAA